MWKVKKEEDYFIPPLAPYVQWVRAYDQLVSVLYEEHKTVRRAWKAFRDAVPGIERRLAFDVFEQILLFSLFLSEWNKSEKTAPSGEIDGRQGSSKASDAAKASDEELEELMEKLLQAIEERDRALWNIKNYEREALGLRERKAQLENEAARFDRAQQVLRNDLNGAREELVRVTQELDKSRGEVDSLREENLALKAEKSSFEQQLEVLMAKRRRCASDHGSGLRVGPVKAQSLREGRVQMVTQWRRRSGSEAVTQKPEGAAPPRIGRWNAQLSSDGYYRLFRKIGGKLHSIYIGKELDMEKAELRIAEKERELLGPNQAP